MSEFSRGDMQNFDGTQRQLSSKERYESRDAFKSGIDRLLYKHRDYIDPVLSGNGVELSLEARTANGEIVSFEVSQNANGPTLSEKIGKVSVDFATADLYAQGPTHTYEADNDSTVRRHDLDVSKLWEGDDLTYMSTANPADRETFLDTFQERARVYQENRPLAQQMGLNEQPVSPGEIQALFTAAEKADIPVITFDSLVRELKQDALEGSMIDEENKVQARALFTNVVNTFLDRHTEEVTSEGEYKLWRGQDNYLSTDVDGTLDVTVTSEETGADPHVSVQWINRSDEGNDTAMLNYGLHEETLYGQRVIRAEREIFPGVFEKEEHTLSTPVSPDHIKKVRNFLRDRKIS